MNLGLKEENIRLRDHEKEELSHYSNATTDFEFLFPFGWGELWGVADRTDYDLTAHQTVSGESMEYFDQENNERINQMWVNVRCFDLASLTWQDWAKIAAVVIVLAAAVVLYKKRDKIRMRTDV